jgi:hypothetical protein
VRGYVVGAYEDTNGDIPGRVRVYLHGKLVYRLAVEEALTYRLGLPADPVNKIPLVPDGSDLTGNGRPDMMVTSWLVRIAVSRITSSSSNQNFD